jgi:hypothetical protein
MAPEFVVEHLPKKKRGETLTVLDPMMGSGTIPVLASIAGHRAVGFDTDPLAIIIARTWARPLKTEDLMASAEHVAERARARAHRDYRHPDDETQDFIDYWFDRKAQRRLGALAASIGGESPALHDALWCSFSRLIITKDAGASLARDVSHSRPHRVRSVASFNPTERFIPVVAAVIDRHQALEAKRAGARRLRLDQADARDLPLRDGSVDAVITSPPYLQAIDYLRGHRMSLVWMGYSLGELRELRSSSMGTERGLPETGWQDRVMQGIAGSPLSTRGTAILQRYISDLSAVLKEIRRVLRPRAQATFVVAEATLEGAPVKLSAALEWAAKRNGLKCTDRESRDLPASRRYLPPPTENGAGSLDRRMKTEWCLTFGPA